MARKTLRILKFHDQERKKKYLVMTIYKSPLEGVTTQNYNLHELWWLLNIAQARWRRMHMHSFENSPYNILCNRRKLHRQFEPLCHTMCCSYSMHLTYTCWNFSPLPTIHVQWETQKYRQTSMLMPNKGLGRTTTQPAPCITVLVIIKPVNHAFFK